MMRFRCLLIFVLIFLSGLYSLVEIQPVNGAMTIPNVEIIFDEELIHVDVSGDENISVEISGYLKVKWVDYIDSLCVDISAYSSVFSDLDWSYSVDIEKPDDTVHFDFFVEVERNSYSEEKHVMVGGRYEYTYNSMDHSYHIENGTRIKINPYYRLFTEETGHWRSCEARRGSWGEFQFNIENQGNNFDDVILFVINEDDLERNGIEVTFPGFNPGLMAGGEEVFKVRANVSNDTKIGTYDINIGMMHLNENGEYEDAEDISVKLELIVTGSSNDLGYPSISLVVLLVLILIPIFLSYRRRGVIQ